MPRSMAHIGLCFWIILSTLALRYQELAVLGICAIDPVDGHVDIPSSWDSIPEFAFDDCAALSTVNIPSSIHSIGMMAFDNCTSLTSLDIPDSVISIGMRAFSECTSLKSVTLGEQVKTLGDSVFSGCFLLTVVDLPDSLLSIPEMAFRNCWNLESFIVPDGVKTIGSGAFENCSSLQVVTMGQSVVAIESYAFHECFALQSLSLSESVVTIGWFSFSYAKLKSITFGKNVREVGDFAFAFNFDLSRVEIKSPHITFNDSVFSNCYSLVASSQIFITKQAESITNLRGDLADFQCSNGKCVCKAGYGNGIIDAQYVDSYFTCVFCRAGKSNVPLSQNECQPCPQGTYADLEGSPSCTDCSSGTYSTIVEATNSSVCQKCSLGKYTASQGSSGCQACPPGNFCNETGLAGYFACSVGYYSDKYGQTQCSACSPGQYQNRTGSPTCSLCGIGTYNPSEKANSSKSCLSCPSGKYAATQSLSACQDCGKDHFTDDTMPIKSTCVECKPGMTTEGSGATICTPDETPCLPGFMRSDDGLCVPCKSGQYSVDGRACSKCEKNSYSAQTGSQTCTLCPAGRFGVADESDRSSLDKACQLCPPGKFVSTTGSSSCQNCPPGSYCDKSGMSVSEPCPVGRYTDEKCQLACQNCPPGRYQQLMGSAKCHACPNGTDNALEQSINKTACLYCAQGKYAREEGMSDCLTCPSGQYASDTGQTECQVCSDIHGPTYTSNTDKTGCVENNALKTNSLTELLFHRGGALYGTFSVAIVFILVAFFVQKKRANYKGRIAKIGWGRAFGRAMVSGFLTGSEFFLIAVIWLQAPYLGGTMLFFRLIHIGGGMLLIVCIFAQREDIVRVLKENVPYFATLGEFINKGFARKNMSLLCVISFAMTLDLSMLTFLPWKESRFYRESYGMPSMEVMKFYLALTTLHSLISVCCEISYLSFFTYPSGINNDIANALFALNITMSVCGVFAGFLQYFLKNELLTSLQKDIDGHLESKQKEHEAAIEVEDVTIQMQDLYVDKDNGNSLVDNPMREDPNFNLPMSAPHNFETNPIRKAVMRRSTSKEKLSDTAVDTAIAVAAAKKSAPIESKNSKPLSLDEVEAQANVGAVREEGAKSKFKARRSSMEITSDAITTTETVEDDAQIEDNV